MGRQGPWAHRPDIRGAAVQGVGRGPEGRHETGGLRGAVRARHGGLPRADHIGMGGAPRVAEGAGVLRPPLLGADIA